MTKKQLLWATGIGLAITVVLIAGYGVLPVRASWKVNRILHHAWQGVVGLAAVGGVTWALWPRPKARRRDLERKRARRRLPAVAVVVLVAVAMVAGVEIWRDRATRGFLDPAEDDLTAIAAALKRYAADHAEARPPTPKDLVPKYLARDRLYYTYRNGPSAAGPPPEATDEKPSYALVKQKAYGQERARRQEPRILAYLRPGNAWGPLTVALDRAGRPRVVGEDRVAQFETDQQAP